LQDNGKQRFRPKAVDGFAESSFEDGSIAWTIVRDLIGAGHQPQKLACSEAAAA